MLFFLLILKKSNDSLKRKEQYIVGLITFVELKYRTKDREGV